MTGFPLIGVTVDHLKHPTAETENTFTVRTNYVTALRILGAQAILLPCDIDAIPRFLGLCDGVLVTGSEPGEAGTLLRQDFERELLMQTHEQNIPTLGICNGMQIMGQILGATLCTPLVNELDVDHKPLEYPTAPAHDLIIAPEGFLAQMAEMARTEVNSYHNQCLGDDGQFDVLARAPDGVVEAIAAQDHPFFVGVQWHPEYLLSAFDHALLERFVAACDVCRQMN